MSKALEQKEDKTLTETIKIIARQTSIDDTLYIERVLMECNNDIAKTILTLIGSNTPDKQDVQEPTVFDQIRTILNEKDTLYHSLKAYKTQS